MKIKTGRVRKIPRRFLPGAAYGSAKKHGGVPLYKLAREESSGARATPRPRLSDTIDGVHSRNPFQRALQQGFYVRTYVHDIGEVSGARAFEMCAGRNRPIRCANAITVDEIKKTPCRTKFSTDAESAGSFQDAGSVEFRCNSSVPFRASQPAALSRHRCLRRVPSRASAVISTSAGHART